MYRFRNENDLNLTLIFTLFLYHKISSILLLRCISVHCVAGSTSFTPFFIISRLTAIATSPVNRVALFSIHTVSTFFRTSGPIHVVLAFYKVHVCVSVYHKTLSDGTRLATRRAKIVKWTPYNKTNGDVR